MRHDGHAAMPLLLMLRHAQQPPDALCARRAPAAAARHAMRYALRALLS
jgi:hypothetical protein